MKNTPEYANTVHVEEDFLNVDTRSLDSKQRITLSEKVINKVVLKNRKVQSYQVLVAKNGNILLRPAVSVPANEAWIYENPKVIGAIRQGLKDAKEGKTTRAVDQDKFFKSLWILF